MEITIPIFISIAMFVIGMVGVLMKRNTLVFFLAIELMLNAANLLFVTFARQWGNQIGLLFVFFVLLVAAAEAAVGLAMIIHLFRTKKMVDIDSYNSLRG